MRVVPDEAGPSFRLEVAMCRGFLSLLIGVFLSPFSPSLSAQTFLVNVNEAETGHPIYGAFVTLLDQEGQRVRSALTNEQGRFLFNLPEVGAYSVRAQMIGRETRVSPLALVSAEERLTQEISLPVRAIELRGITAEGAARCIVRPEVGERTAVVWEEARKTLEVAAWAVEEELFRYRLDHRVREYGPDGQRILGEQYEVREGYFPEPFVSRPARNLAERGFVQVTDEDTLAFAPGAAVLLSDPFLDTHCFRVRRAPDDDLIGLAFEPIARRRVPDIKGTLWLDPSTGELRSVDFTYTGNPREGWQEDAGGRVEFERLPSGAWIVRRWHITMPIMAEVERRVAGIRAFEMRRVGFQEEGGEVLRVVDQEGAVVVSADRALLSGTVYDSVRGAPLADARVYLAGTGWEAIADEEGRFRIPNLPGGSFTVEASHPRLDSLKLEVLAQRAKLVEGRMTWVEMAVSQYSASEYVNEQGVRGWVRGRAGEPRPGAFVVLLDAARGQEAATLTDGAGEFFLLADRPGRYRLHIDEIGREAWESDPFELANERMFRPQVEYAEPEVDLSSSSVGESSVCTVDPGPTSLAGRALNEVRKALTLEVWGRTENLLEHELVLFDRERSPQDLEVWEDTLWAAEGFVEPIFPTRHPQELADVGFAPTLGDSAYVFAPTPEVILSRPFLSTHCFRVEPSDRDSRLTLVFEPIRRRPDAVDVRGAFFLDRESGNLRSLAYRYTEFPGPEGVGLPSGETRALSHETVGLSSAELPVSPGGWMNYQRLPNGSWMISDWGSRLPILLSIMDTTRTDSTPNLAVFAVSERGGVVLTTRRPEGDTLWTGSSVRATALSVDSTWAVGAMALFQPTEAFAGAPGRPGADPETRETSGFGRVRGRVVAWEGRDPLPGVEIVLARVVDPVERSGPPPSTLSTNEDGSFLFPELRPGLYTVRASLLGRGPVEDSVMVEPGRSLNLEIRLPTDPIPLEGIVVEVESRDLGLEIEGFFERRARQPGIFLTQDQIERRLANSIYDIFAGFSNVRVVSSGIFKTVEFGGTRALTLTGGCYPPVWLDAQLVHLGGIGNPPLLDQMVDPNEIAGLEVYTSTSRVPVRFNVNAGCGVIVIWTSGGS